MNEIAPDDVHAFLERQRIAIDAGGMDDAIAAALSNDGPGKAFVRVRAIGGDADAD